MRFLKEYRIQLLRFFTYERKYIIITKVCLQEHRMKMIFRERAEFSAVREDEIIFRRGGCPKKGGFFCGNIFGLCCLSVAAAAAQGYVQERFENRRWCRMSDASFSGREREERRWKNMMLS